MSNAFSICTQLTHQILAGFQMDILSSITIWNMKGGWWREVIQGMSNCFNRHVWCKGRQGVGGSTTSEGQFKPGVCLFPHCGNRRSFKLKMNTYTNQFTTHRQLSCLSSPTWCAWWSRVSLSGLVYCSILLRRFMLWELAQLGLKTGKAGEA